MIQGIISKPEIGIERTDHVVFDVQTCYIHTVFYAWLYVNEHVSVYIYKKKY